ncbi:hypothetical protein L6164_024553 [Bauhinia variegata]|uniref:Uncharacterized protein n=1 Tax=Bauhinia variegata TaxID=167791 RepID=A0ACB9LYS9_BAUVA|nr:hypothetical protein L6164_024553 [Bauhinia variegata]
MILVSQAHGGPLSAKCLFSSSSPIKFIHGNPSVFSNRKSKFNVKPLHLTLARAEGGVESDSTSKPVSSASPSIANDETVFVGSEDIPLEGVIQFDKPTSSKRLEKWGRVALFAAGDVVALVLFTAIGRFSHGFSVLDMETLRTADPFIAGWSLSAYFLGGYGEEGRGMNGLSKGIIATAKSWALGIPVGIGIRAATSGHFPNYGFIFVTMGSTAVLLMTFRALLYTILPIDNSKSDVYRRGNPFELFELLTSLIRRW